MVCRHSGLGRRPSDMSSRNLMWQGDVCAMISVCDHKFCLMRGRGHPGECHTPAVFICCGACDILSVIPRTQVAFQRDEYHFVAMILTKWSTPLTMFFWADVVYLLLMLDYEILTGNPSVSQAEALLGCPVHKDKITFFSVKNWNFIMHTEHHGWTCQM